METYENLVIVEAGENACFSFLAWKQKEMEVRLKCLECYHLGAAHRIICHRSGQHNLNEDCFFCGTPMLGEVVFV